MTRLRDHNAKNGRLGSLQRETPSMAAYVIRVPADCGDTYPDSVLDGPTK